MSFIRVLFSKQFKQTFGTLYTMLIGRKNRLNNLNKHQSSYLCVSHNATTSETPKIHIILYLVATYNTNVTGKRKLYVRKIDDFTRAEYIY